MDFGVYWGTAVPHPLLQAHLLEHSPGRPSGCVTALLEVKDLSIRFGGITALDGVSFSVQQGEILSIIGPNGAGKTSVFNCITRIYDPNGGAIEFKGQDLLRMRP